MMHPCLNRSLPPDGVIVEYEISNRGFSDLLHTYCCDFLNNVYVGKCVLLW